MIKAFSHSLGTKQTFGEDKFACFERLLYPPKADIREAPG